MNFAGPAMLRDMVSPASRRLDAKTRRRQILHEAERLFVARGFEGVGMGDIAQALRTSRPTVYGYFPSTEAMLDALLDERLERLPERLRPYLRGEEGTQFERLFLALLAEKDLLLLLGAGGGPLFRRKRAAFFGALEARLKVAELPRAAGIQPDQLPVLTFLLVNLLSSAATAYASADAEGQAAGGQAVDVQAVCVQARAPLPDSKELAAALGAFARGGVARLTDEAAVR